MDITETIEALAVSAVAQNLFPGCVIAYSTPTEKNILAIGHLSYDPDSAKTEINTLYDVASVTKSVPTALLAVHLIDKGKLSLDDPVSRYIPELAMAQREAIEIKHLLTFTLRYGFGLAELRSQGADGVLDAIYTMPLAAPVGSEFAYANATSILLGQVLERVTDRPLGELATTHFFEPLGIEGLMFEPPRTRSVAPSEIDGSGVIIQGVVHDETARLFRLSGRQIGSAGLFGEAVGFRTLLEALISGEPLSKAGVMSAAGIATMLSRHTPPGMPSYGLGWNLNDPAFMGERASETTFGKTGFTGCSIVADRRAGWTCVILSNSTFPSRHHNPQRASLMNQFRASVAGAVAGARA